MSRIVLRPPGVKLLARAEVGVSSQFTHEQVADRDSKKSAAGCFSRTALFFMG
ncbi:MAG: hypothetical protein IRZ24_04030 [Thermogemmatispora sp.]|uniref:hypothetical protein n=1 Tax=Thermogemmatispora sp. TaxID=1968838 RepID=UPI001DE9BD2B|nr:hypothetical protein [Thermogemmatispora sp.]MBX5449213.1 hypothetical protein [Thermogemmatispora sp.]